MRRRQKVVKLDDDVEIVLRVPPTKLLRDILWLSAKMQESPKDRIPADKEFIETMINVAKECVKTSNPTMKDEEVDEIVSMYFAKIIEEVFKLIFENAPKV